MWLFMLASCVLGPRPDACTNDTECRQAFGFGATCGDEGYCEAAPAFPRCERTWPEDLLTRPEKYGDAFVIATILEHGLDEPQLNAAELVVKRLDEAGGLDGRRLGVVHCDNHNDNAYDDLDVVAAAGASATFVVKTLGVQAIMGPSSSDSSFAVFDAVGGAGAMMVSPSATSVELTAMDGTAPSDDNPGLFWRTVPPDDLQALAIATDMLDRGLTRVTVVNQDSSYGVGLASRAIDSLEQAGVEVTRFQFSDAVTRDTATSDAGQSPAEEVLFLSSEIGDVVAFINAVAVSPSFDGKTLFMGDTASDPVLFEQVSPAGEALFPRIRGTRPALPSGAVFEAFNISYAAEYGEDASEAVYAPYAFDATNLILYGSAWAVSQEGTLSGQNIAKGLRQITADVAASEHIPVRVDRWADVVDAFEAGKAINVDGASGDLDYSPLDEETTNPIEVWTINGASFEVVKVCQPGGSCADA